MSKPVTKSPTVQAALASLKPLHDLQAAVDKAHGEGSMMLLGAGQTPARVDVVSTGSRRLDRALGVGGLPRGRVVEIYGPESAGKTTLTLHTIAQAQRLGLDVAFIDAEHALDIRYAKTLGVDPERLLVSQPDCGEQALEIAEMTVSTGAIGVVVVDSVAALTPRSEIEGEMGDAQMGAHARLMSQAMRKLCALVHKQNVLVIFTNQIRMKIGVMFGSPETTTGGNALKFYASVRLDIRRIGALKDGEAIVGNKTRVKVVKNKLAPPFREVEFDIRYGRGIDQTAELLDLAEEAGVVEKKGSWFSFAGDKIAQGKEAALTYLAEHQDITAAISAALVKKETDDTL